MHFFFSFGLCLLLGRYYILKCQSLKIGHTVRVADVDALFQDYSKASSIPSMGGLFVNFTIILVSILCLELNLLLSIFLLTLSLFSCLGVFDDLGKKVKKEMRANTKFLFQLLFASGLVYGLSFFVSDADKLLIPFIKDPVDVSLYISYPLMVFVIIAASNAVNLSDGLDGLAAGCSLFVFLTFSVLIWSINPEYSGLFGLCLIVMGALLGFLLFNRYPAKVFMGDVGSLSLGALMAVFAIVLRAEFYLALVGFVFVVETLSVILQVLVYRFYNRRVFLCAPIHHHFQMQGVSEQRVVLYLHLISFILSCVAIGWLLCTYVL